MYTTSSSIRDVFIIPTLYAWVFQVILTTMPDLSSNSINQMTLAMHLMLSMWYEIKFYVPLNQGFRPVCLLSAFLIKYWTHPCSTILPPPIDVGY